MSKKILITGITGFAGSHLAEQLLKSSEDKIYGTYHSSFDEQSLPFLKQAHVERLDITSEQDVLALLKKIQPNEIYHLAAAASPSGSVKHPQKTFEANILGQLNILEGVKSIGLRNTRILLVTSAEVYGKVIAENLPVDESVTFNPMNPYAVSKIAQDFLGLQYFNSELMDIIRVRPFNHIGPRQSPTFVVSAFAKQLVEIENSQGVSGVMKVGNLEAIRDFTDVHDMVSAYSALMEKGRSGDVYNVGSGKGVKIADILSQLQSFTNKEITIEEDPERIRPVDIPELVCDASKMKLLTGWEPLISLDQSLESVLGFWREKINS